MTLETYAALIHLFICTFCNYLLNIYDVPGAVLATGYTEVSKAAMVFAFMGNTAEGRRQSPIILPICKL